MRPIDADALKLHIKDLPTWHEDIGGRYPNAMKYPDGMFDCEDIMSSIELAPTLDDLRPKGEWKIMIDDYDCEFMKCSVCGERFYDGDNDTVDCKYNFCPNCGAKLGCGE